MVVLIGAERGEVAEVAGDPGGDRRVRAIERVQHRIGRGRGVDRGVDPPCVLAGGWRVVVTAREQADSDDDDHHGLHGPRS